MIRKLLVLSILLLAMAAVVPAQVPWDCACTNTRYVTSATNSSIGSVTITFNGGYPTTQECQVTIIGGSTYCTVSGTITLNYWGNTTGFTPTFAAWGDPTTNFTPSPGVTPFYPAPLRICNPNTTLGLKLTINGFIGGSQTSLTADCRWSCEPI